MQLTLFTDYVLRTLLYLGTHREETVPASAISEAFRISPDHVAKAAKWLTQRGLVETQRGRKGGLRLARPVRSIRLGALIRETEPHLDLLECFDDRTNTCRLSPGCRLKNALHEARKAFLDVLDGYTLADLLENTPQLLVLLDPRRRRPAVS